MFLRIVAVLTVVASCSTAGLAEAAPSAQSSDAFAPLDRDGPPLSVAPKKLGASIDCSEDGAAGQRWVLLIHGTGADSQINWSWNHIPALDQLGIPWCTVDLPVGGSGDLQSNAEYVVNAIRVVYRRSGKRIGIIGHSQGGISPRWAFRFWPDTRKMVDDLVGYAPPNHGSASADATCEADGPCSPSNHQFRTDSKFNVALNSFTETFPGISYTNVYSHTDFIATPNADDTGTSSLHVGQGAIANIAIQDICPLQTSEHLGLAYDAVAWALAYDALAHPGPAVAGHIPLSVCAELIMPGVNKATFAADVARAAAGFLTSPSVPDVSSEPTLSCYVFAAGCMRLMPVTRRLVLDRDGVALRLRCTDAAGRSCSGRAAIDWAGRKLAAGTVKVRSGSSRASVLRLTRAGTVLLRRSGRTTRQATVEIDGLSGVVSVPVRLRIGGAAE